MIEGMQAQRTLEDGQIIAVTMMILGKGRLLAGVDETGYKDCW